MRKIPRKALSLLLLLVLVCGLCVSTAFNAESRYSDTNGHWAEAAIERWSDYGIVQGYGDTFSPDASLTRAQMATALSNALGLTETADNPFSDVAESDWFAAYVLRCYAAGVMMGDSGKANPNASITRQQAMVMLCRALAIAPMENPDLSGYTDSEKVEDWAAPYVTAMVESSIVTGIGNNQLDPNGNLSRGALMTILDRSVVQYINKPGNYNLANKDGIILVASGEVTLSGNTHSDILVTPAADGKNLSFDKATVTGTVTVQADNAKITIKNSKLPGIAMDGNGNTIEENKDEVIKPGGNGSSSGGGSSGGGSSGGGSVTGPIEVPVIDGAVEIALKEVPYGTTEDKVKEILGSQVQLRVQNSTLTVSGKATSWECTTEGGYFSTVADKTYTFESEVTSDDGYAVLGKVKVKGSVKVLPLNTEELNQSKQNAQTLLSKVKTEINPGGTYEIAESADAVDTGTSFVTPSMVNALRTALDKSAPSTGWMSQNAVDAAVQELNSAIGGFNPAAGTRVPGSSGGSGDEEQPAIGIEAVKTMLTSGKNKNVTTYTRNGDEMAILWTYGITPPDQQDNDTDDFTKLTEGEYVYEYANPSAGSGWYDVNKKEQSGTDRLMCYAAVSANQMHWWMTQNQDNIRRYMELNDPASNKMIQLKKFLNSYNSQSESSIYHQAYWELFASLDYAHNADVVNDYVINGYPFPTRDKATGFKNQNNTLTTPAQGAYAGLFYDVFGGTLLTNREPAGSYERFSETLIAMMKDAKSVGLIHMTGGYNTHIITVWGVELDSQGKLVAVYVSDSDNTDSSQVEQAMERKLIRDSGGVLISTNIKNLTHGPTITTLVSLSLGEDSAWQKYFDTHPSI